jgi:hypothetical protein
LNEFFSKEGSWWKPCTWNRKDRPGDLCGILIIGKI